MRLILFLLITLLNIPILCQTLVLENEISIFSNATSFSIDPLKNIYVAEGDNNEIIKLDTTGVILKKIGGFGWGSSSFDFPADIFAFSLKIYAADKNNDRIQIFDKDLNYLSEFSTKSKKEEDYFFRRPSCIAISNQGDFIILDSDNNRILKFDMSGNFNMQIGGFDAGDYSLISPNYFCLDSQGNLYVIDGDKLVIFDPFGAGKAILSIPIIPNHISFSGELLINDSFNIYKINIQDYSLSEVLVIPVPESIIEIEKIDNSYYVLTNKSLAKYKMINE
ncbi:MAG: NHL repeat-containing protein [Ignavibacteriaceae bacterium]|jgi:DNA-binding beta-propeller fold protein YncE|nr:NHL repeat-containing protein [Ignavibacteriaceae bacterium]